MLGCSVTEAQQRISSSEFTEWLAYSQIEPFGNRRDDIRAGVIAATVANVYRKKGTRAIQPTDFFPDPLHRQQSWEEQLRVVEMLNAAFGGKDLRGNNEAA